MIPNHAFPALEVRVTAVDLTLGSKPTGDVVVVAGGGQVGCDVALHLARQGKHVTIVETETLAYDANPISQREVRADGVICAGTDGRDQMIEADSVVIAMGSVSRETPDDCKVK